MQNVLLVWSGELETSLTAGWLGLPCLGNPAWYAIARLWRHEGDARMSPSQPSSTPSGAESFTNLPAPSPVVTFKDRPDAAPRAKP